MFLYGCRQPLLVTSITGCRDFIESGHHCAMTIDVIITNFCLWKFFYMYGNGLLPFFTTTRFQVSFYRLSFFLIIRWVLTLDFLLIFSYFLIFYYTKIPYEMDAWFMNNEFKTIYIQKYSLMWVYISGCTPSVYHRMDFNSNWVEFEIGRHDLICFCISFLKIDRIVFISNR